jgi:hypothetical protein
MISSSLKGLWQSRGDDPNCIASHRVCNEQQTALDHAKRGETLLALVLAIVNPIEGEWVFEYVSRGLERDAMLGVVRCGLDVVPLECAIIHEGTA